MPKIQLLRMLQDKAMRLGCDKEDVISIGLELVSRMPEEQLAMAVNNRRSVARSDLERALN